MKFIYADPPYLDCCSYYKHEHNDGGDRPFDGRCWNELATHRLLISWLRDNAPDGWALSLSVPSLLDLARSDAFPMDVRVGVWVKPFASFKPGINPGYCWEPVIFRGGRKLGRDVDTVRDYVSANIVLEKGTPGAKPAAFCNWVLDFLGFQPGDRVDDLFPGSGAFGRVVAMRNGVPPEQMELIS